MERVAKTRNVFYDQEDESLSHYGMPRRSGRYPWGSGENPYQHGGDFLVYVDQLKKLGWEETTENIKKTFGLTTADYRDLKSYANTERRMLQVATARRLRDKEGLGATEIGRRMGINESTVRTLLNEDSERRMNAVKNTADFLKQQVDEKRMIDVGAGTNIELNVSPEKMRQALKVLEAEGYHIYKGGIPQVTNKGQQSNQVVLAKPDVEHKEIYNYDQVHSIKEYSSADGGNTFKKFQYPSSMDSKRLMIRYAEDGGKEKDGLVELRPGVADLSLGNDRYSQIRILVDGKKYIKGMALYTDFSNVPKGIDVIFNTNKSKSVSKLDTLKDIKEDPENPFGSLIKANGQSEYTGKDGKQHLSLINKRAGEGDWSDWADTLPSQFLAKQPTSLAKKQLNLALADKKDEYSTIMSLTNPTIKKNLLKSFADSCDSAAVHLKAAALPGQKYHVIIPMNSLPDTQIYAPKYENGTKLALVRYPHGGLFEIPILTVNNKNAQAKKLLGNVTDAVGINSKVAEQLSGADFDGDTVMCIPTHDKNGRVRISNREPLTGLKGFDPKDSYGPQTYEGRTVKLMTKRGMQTEMGMVSNLITDMTLRGADEDELARAVRHSMVVIDAYKHKLDYKQSEKDNNIKQLKELYQDGGGASTLISRAKGEATVDKRQGSPRINLKKNADRNKPGDIWYDPSRPEGALLYKTADDLEYKYARVNKRTGETTTITKHRTQPSTNMAETDDARTLISDANTRMENLYASYANSLKSMANHARVEYDRAGKIAYDRKANQLYKTEVDSLKTQLSKAESNRPKERMAQRLVNADIAARKADNPDLTGEDEKKLKQQLLTKYRNQVGAQRTPIEISDREWEAIQAGAISESYLQRILNNTDADKLKERAMPRDKKSVTQSQINRIKAMNASNYSIEEIASKIGLSPSTVAKYLQ